MEFEQFYLSCLAHASYLLGSDGVAAVVDPQRDVECYLDEARARGLRIAYVIETHVHADFVSGHRELAERCGAQVYIGARAHAAYPHVAVRDGDELRFGACRCRFLETPGHTPESICVAVTDEERSPQPFAVLTGDTLFVGDVGRPDLGAGQSPAELAGMLYDSLHAKLLTLPDDVGVFPAHGAGSLCGRSMSSERSSTIGRERRTNPALQAATREDFVRLAVAELPDRPAYFARDAEINRAGPTTHAAASPPEPLAPAALLEAQREGAIVLDTRDEVAFGAAHVPNAVNIGLAGQFAAWAATVLGLDVPIVLVADDEAHAHEGRVRLARVGIESVRGFLAGGMQAWRDAGLPTAAVPQISPDELRVLLRERPGDLCVLDVRRRAEWDDGHVEGARHMPLATLSATLGELDAARPTAVYCKGGYRSSVATSLLRRAAFAEVLNLSGGYDAWLAGALKGEDDDGVRASGGSGKHAMA